MAKSVLDMASELLQGGVGDLIEAQAKKATGRVTVSVDGWFDVDGPNGPLPSVAVKQSVTFELKDGKPRLV